MARLKNNLDAPLPVSVGSNKSIHFKSREVLDVPDSYLEYPEVKIKIKRGILQHLIQEQVDIPAKSKIKK